MKKLTIIVLSIILLFTILNLTVFVDAAPVSFKDTENHWARDTIESLVKRGIINGYTDGTFQPNANVHVDAFIKMTVTALGYQLENGSTYWASTYIDKAKELGLVKDGEFTDYKRPIIREEMARIAVRAILDYEKKDGFMYQAVKNGLLKGYTDGTLKPTGLTTRAESAVILERMLTLKSGGTLSVDKIMQEKAEVYDYGSNAETIMGVGIKKLPITVDMGTVDVVIEEILVYDETNPDTAYYLMFEHAKIPPSNKEKHYRLAFKLKGINKQNTQYTVYTETFWHIDSQALVAREDAEKFGYFPFRYTLEPKGKEGSIQTGFHILGRDKEELKQKKSIVVRIKTYTGVYKDLVLTGRE